MLESIISDLNTMMGRPVIAGTRITVELSLGRLDAGESIGHLLASYPRLTHEAVLSALGFARRVVASLLSSGHRMLTEGITE